MIKYKKFGIIVSLFSVPLIVATANAESMAGVYQCSVGQKITLKPNGRAKVAFGSMVIYRGNYMDYGDEAVWVDNDWKEWTLISKGKNNYQLVNTNTSTENSFLAQAFGPKCEKIKSID